MQLVSRLFAEATKIDARSIGLPKIAANQTFIKNVVGGVFVFIGAFAVLFLLIGAIRYIASNGDQGQISRAKDTILYALVGIALSVSAFTIVQFVLGGVG